LDPAVLFRLAGFEPDVWQADAVRGDGDRVLILASRQVGKSLTTGIKAIHRAVFYEESLILLFAPSQRQSQELFKKVIDNYHRIGEPVPVARELQTSIELANGSRIVSLPGDPATVRGFSGVALVVVDEAAMVSDDGLFTAILPMTATSEGAVWALSTPMGRRGFFFEAWTGDDPAWTRITAMATACPRIPAAFLAEQRRTLGERWFQQEYACEFVDTFGSVFSEEEVAGLFGEHASPLLDGF
jgi:hypothetical protein